MNIIIVQEKDFLPLKISKKNTLLDSNIKYFIKAGFLSSKIFILGTKNKTSLEATFIQKLSDIPKDLQDDTLIINKPIYLYKNFIKSIKKISSKNSIQLLGGKENTGLYFIPKDNLLSIDISKLNKLKGDNYLSNNDYKLINNINDINVIRKEIAIKKPEKAFIHCPHVTLAADKFYNYPAFYIVRLFIPYGITPNQVSTLSFILSIIGIVLFIFKSYWLMIFGLILLHIGFIFDCVDGGLARIKMCGSNAGGFLDSTFDSIKMTLLIFGIIYYDFSMNENIIILILGIILFGLKYTNTTIYNNATHFAKNTLASNFVPKKGIIATIMSKLNIKPNQLTLSNDILLIIFSFGLIFNQNIFIFSTLGMYYILQGTIFGIVTFKKLNNQIK